MALSLACFWLFLTCVLEQMHHPRNIHFIATCTAIEKNGLRSPSKKSGMINQEEDTEETWIRVSKYLEIKLRKGIIQTYHMMWN